MLPYEYVSCTTISQSLILFVSLHSPFFSLFLNIHQAKLGFLKGFDIFFNIYIYILSAMDLHCCMQASSSCREQRLLSSCSARASYCGGFSCYKNTDSRAHWLQQLVHMGSEVVVHRLSYPMACRILPEKGSNQCPLHCKVDS